MPLRRLLALGCALTPLGALAASRPEGWGLAAFPVLAFERYSAGVGWQLHPMLAASHLHEGIDIAAPEGSPVRSWWRGRVTAVINDRGCGLGLQIRSGDYEHLYCHLSGAVSGGVYASDGGAADSSGIRLRPGDPVETGQLIARVGRTGMATGPHLHWSLRWRGLLLDPLPVLRAMAGGRTVSAAMAGSRPNLGSLR